MHKANTNKNQIEMSRKELKSIAIAILVCFFHAFSKGPHSIIPIFSIISNLDPISLNTYILSANIIAWTCQCLNILIYFLFNKEFEIRFKMIFLKTKTKPEAQAIR